MSKPKIVLVGGGGHCRSCIDVVEQEGRFEIYGIVEQEGSPSREVQGYPVVGNDDDLPSLRNEAEYALVTIGQIKSSASRVSLFKQIHEAGFRSPSIVSPLAYVSKNASLGEGSIVMHRSIVNAGAEVGVGCILNSCSLVEHDAWVGDFVHVSTGAIINGDVKVLNNSFIGSGSVVVHGVALPEYSFVRAGQLVITPDDIRTIER